MNIYKKIFTNEHLELFSSGQIRIPNKATRMKQGFESLTQRFEPLKLELWRTRQGDSNLWVMDSNPLAKVKAEGWRLDRAIRIVELWIRIPLGVKFKSHSGDSNPLHSDSNPSWRKIQISLRRFESFTQRFESLLAQNSNLAQVIRIPYTTIRIPNSAEALNARPATPSTWFSSQISLTMAS